jgi:hypothetical protein
MGSSVNLPSLTTRESTLDSVKMSRRTVVNRPRVVVGARIPAFHQCVNGVVHSRCGNTISRVMVMPLRNESMASASAWQSVSGESSQAWDPESCGLAEGVNAGLSNLEKSYL